MALDPEIAMGYRFPQVQVNIPQPLQQLGQVLTLRGLMQEGQLRELSIKQQQLAYQQALGLANLFKEPDTTQAPAAAVAPGSVIVGQGQSRVPIHSPDGGTTWMDSVTGVPYTGPRYGETPIISPGAGSIAPVQTPPPATMPSLVGQPPTYAPFAAAAPYDASATSLPPIVSPVSTPAPTPAASAMTAAPAPATVQPQPAQAPAPAFPRGGLPGLPTWQRMIQVGGASAFPWIKNINEAQSAQLDIQKKQLDVAKGQSEDMVRLSNGMTTNEFKNDKLHEAGLKGYIPWDDVRKYTDMDVNDPRFQAQKESWGQSALTYDKSVELGIKRNEEARNQNKEVRDWVEFHNKQFEQEVSDFKGQVGALTDASKFGPLLSTKSDRLKAMYGGLVGQSLNDIKVWTGAGKVGETVNKPQSVLDTETAQAAARAGAEDLARKTAMAQYYAPTTASVLANKTRLQDVDPEIQKIIMPALIEGGYGQSGTPTAAAGGSFAKLISDAERERLGDYDRATTVLQDTLGKVTDPENVARMGPFAGQLARNPYATNYGNLQSDLIAQQQQLKKFATNGLLRGVTPEMIDKLFPTITTHPDKAKHQIENWLNLARAEKQQYLRDLADKVIPPALKGTQAAPPAAPEPPYQTIERTGAPGPRVTGAFTIGQGPGTAPAVAPPNRIAVTGPDGKGYWLRADQWPDAQRQGYTRQ